MYFKLAKASNSDLIPACIFLTNTFKGIKMGLQLLENQIEALIFASDKGISFPDIKQLLSEITELEILNKDIEHCLLMIGEKYRDKNFSIELLQLNAGYQFLTKKEYYPVIRQLNQQKAKKALSQAALETLAIIAYKNPVTKLEIEQIRGVNCDYSIQKLLDKELIVISGRSNSAGKPILYSISGLFMDYFAINSLSDLPKLKDIVSQNNEIGTQGD